MAKAKVQRESTYTVNTKIKDLTEQQLKEYAERQQMSVTDVLNVAVWYAQQNNIDLAIWAIHARRKLKEDKEQE